MKQIWRIRRQGGHSAKAIWTKHAMLNADAASTDCGIYVGGKDRTDYGFADADVYGKTLQGEKRICQRCFPHCWPEHQDAYDDEMLTEPSER